MTACLRAALIAALVLACAGCDSERAPPAGSFDGRDAGAREPDGGESTDGGSADARADDGAAGARTCTLSEDDVLELATTHVQTADAPALAVRNDGALVAWVAIVDGMPRVSALWVPADEGSPSVLTPTDAASRQRTPAAVATSDGFVLVWSDDLDGDYEIRSLRVDPSGAPVAPVRTLTSNTRADELPALGRNPDDRLLLVWKESSVPPESGRAVMLDTDGAPVSSVHTLTTLGASARRIAIGAVDSAFAVVWVATGRVQRQLVSLDAAPSGMPIEVSEKPNATGIVDLAPTPTGAVLTFDVRVDGSRAEVRLRNLDGAGTPTGSEHLLTRSPDQGTSSSVTALRGGFAVAYRRSAGGPEMSMRLALVDGEGEVVSALDLAPTSPPPTFSVVRASPDGQRIFVAWTDRTRMLLARVRCE